MPLLIAARCLLLAPLTLPWAVPVEHARGDESAALPPPRRVVFVANGGGDYRCASQALEQAIQDEGLPLQVQTVLWSHGRGRIFADQIDQANVDWQAHQLAQTVRTERQTCPAGQVYLLGHCAGCAVVLRAAEQLPPGSVDRIILLAPSTHSGYDLCAALHATRQGMDVFFSHKDWFCLGWAASFLHLLDGRCYPASGRHGFTCPAESAAEDISCYEKLRQYPWQPSLEETGHAGGHFGCYQQSFLKAFVLPLMVERP